MNDADGHERDRRRTAPPHHDEAGRDPVDDHGSTDAPDADTVATSSGEHTMDHRAGGDGEHVADRHRQRAEELTPTERAHQRHLAVESDEPVGVDRGDSGPARRG